MKAKTLEDYILAKESSQKHEIAEWGYIRYTLYSQLFAAISDTKDGLVLTVRGRYEHYESEYPAAVIPSEICEPRHFTDILIDEVPNHAIKAMIDFSYREILRTIPLPKTDNIYTNVPYCGIAPIYGDDVKSAIEKKELNAKIVSDAITNQDKSEDFNPPTLQQNSNDYFDDLESACESRFDGIPYKVVNDERAMQQIKNMLKWKSEKEKQRKSEIAATEAED